MERSKYFDIKFYYVRHQVEGKKLSLCYVNSSDNVADLTKNVDKNTFQSPYSRKSSNY